MAKIWLSRGTILKEDSTDAGTEIPLEVVTERLNDMGREVRYLGLVPRPVHPPGEWLLYTVVEVRQGDKPVGDFKKLGFYYVVGLNAEESGPLVKGYAGGGARSDPSSVG
jgi:hypothetical protein